MNALDELNEPQRIAVAHVEGPLLVLAGAGSGKTRVITHRIAHLVEGGVAAWNILALTFTNKAAGEMRQRVEALGVPRGATVCTFHALCARLLREFAAEARVSGDYTIYDRADQLRVTKQALAAAEVDPKVLPAPKVHAAISNAKNDLRTPDEFAAAAETFQDRKIAAVYRHYETVLAANNALDFDDLLGRVAFLLRDRPDVRRRLGERYRHILIDEYQDTNRAQYLIAHGIAMDHRNVCATGDPDQSIYAWRGADIGNILEFETDYPDAVVVRLEENYRSTAPILAAAGRLIAHNSRRRDKALWTRREGGADVSVVRCDDEEAEADEIVRRIAAARRDGCDLRDVAVFYRTNALSRTIERALRQAAVPYRIARGVEFYNRKEIKDVLAYLKVLVNPADDLSCLRVINTPARGIGMTTVKRLLAHGTRRGVRLLDACRLAAEAGVGTAARKKVAAFADLIASLAAGPRGSVRDVMEEVCRRTRLTEALQQKAEAEDDQPLDNIGQLISEAAEFDETSPDGTLADYLHQVSLVSDVDLLEGDSGAVTLMTLHAAKGLEFPVVFVVGCEDDLLPLARGGFDGGDKHIDDLEEERRLAFVGMTRAKERLTLTHADCRRIHGRVEYQTPSRFLVELDGDGVTTEDLSDSGDAPAPRPPRRPRSGGGFYTDVEDRAFIEALAEAQQFPPEYEYLAPGCVVHHPKFGRGKVLKLSHPWPETRAEILFEGVGAKTLVVAMAKLELADD